MLLFLPALLLAFLWLVPLLPTRLQRLRLGRLCYLFLYLFLLRLACCRRLLRWLNLVGFHRLFRRLGLIGFRLRFGGVVGLRFCYGRLLFDGLIVDRLNLRLFLILHRFRLLVLWLLRLSLRFLSLWLLRLGVRLRVFGSLRHRGDGFVFFFCFLLRLLRDYGRILGLCLSLNR